MTAVCIEMRLFLIIIRSFCHGEPLCAVDVIYYLYFSETVRLKQPAHGIAIT